MPILPLEFMTMTALNEWQSRFVTPDSHEIMVTEKPEIILRPRKSTGPITFSYLNSGLEVSRVREYADTMPAAGFIVSRIKKFVWDTEKIATEIKELFT